LCTAQIGMYQRGAANLDTIMSKVST
jgi:hypothetical protein